MLRVPYHKYFGFDIEHLWFPDQAASVIDVHATKADIVFAHAISDDQKVVPEPSSCHRQYSLIKDLAPDEDQLFQSISKHVRSYIKRAKKEGSTVRFFTASELKNNAEIISLCGQLYEEMYQAKGMPSKFNVSLVQAYCDQNALLIGVAYVDAVPVGFDAVILQNEDARLWLAAFSFRESDADSQKISRAHQLLEWELILYLKQNHVMRFDFGGISSPEHPDGISKFKMSFEKENVVSYQNYIVGISLKGKLALLAKDSFSKFRKLIHH